MSPTQVHPTDALSSSAAASLTWVALWLGYGRTTLQIDQTRRIATRSIGLPLLQLRRPFALGDHPRVHVREVARSAYVLELLAGNEGFTLCRRISRQRAMRLADLVRAALCQAAREPRSE
ncbi:MAG: hypothetical protein ACOC1F_12520 [Myxococcota bacterium]